VSKYKGDWWLPDKPELKVKGTLDISQDNRAVLELMGALTEIGPGKPLEFRPEIILGISIGGTRITLHKCIQFHPTLNLGTGAKASSFYASMVFLGEHFNDSRELKFKALYVEFDGLDYWVGVSGFDIQEPNSTTKVLTYRQPGPIQALINGLKVSILFEGLPTIRTPKQVTIRQRTSIELRPKSEESFDDLLKLVFDIQNFLSLAFAQPTSPTRIYGQSDAHKLEINGQTIYPTIRIAVHSTFSTKEIGRVQGNSLITFRDVLGRFGLFLKNWLVKTELLEPVYGGYFAVVYNPQMYLHQKFLSFLNAIESYHRRRIANYELAEAEHLRRLTSILSTAPQEHRKWLERKLRYSNELTLRERLEQIIERYSFLEFRDKGWFVNKVLDTRNYLTHYDPTLKGKSATNDELIEITRKLKVLNETVLLSELGLLPIEVERLIRHSDEYQLASVRLQSAAEVKDE
jgi:hypothetical protein